MPLHKICDYTLPRSQVYVTAIFLGIVAGVANSFLTIDLSLKPILGVWILASLLLVIILHEAVHGAAAALLGHKPLFGLKPPLVYMTFADKIPRNHFILITLAPFVLLDILFILMFARGVHKLFWDLCLISNTIGAVGDIWIAITLLHMPRGSFILDTKSGIEVWAD